jgi:hypothetical protein
MRAVINCRTTVYLAAPISNHYGLGNTHSLVFTGAYHARDTLNQYLFSNNFPFARGYTAVISRKCGNWG